MAAPTLLLNDLLLCETIEFTCPRTILSSNAHFSIEDQAKAACEWAGFELVDYGTYMAVPLPDGKSVSIRLYSDEWVRRFHRGL
jgi:hypothetical protein